MLPVLYTAVGRARYGVHSRFYAGSGLEDIVDGPLRTGSAPGIAAFAQPSGLTSDDRYLYIADSEGSSIRAIDTRRNGHVSTLLGTAQLSQEFRLYTFGDRDGSGEIRRTLKPTHTPHAFVLNATRQNLYMGAIDDRLVKLGQKKEAATQHFLADAIKSVVAGERVVVRKTIPVGCLLEEPPNKTKSGDVTYTRDIAPIVQAILAAHVRRCQSSWKTDRGSNSLSVYAALETGAGLWPIPRRAASDGP